MSSVTSSNAAIAASDYAKLQKVNLAIGVAAEDLFRQEALPSFAQQNASTSSASTLFKTGVKVAGGLVFLGALWKIIQTIQSTTSSKKRTSTLTEDEEEEIVMSAAATTAARRRSSGVPQGMGNSPIKPKSSSASNTSSAAKDSASKSKTTVATTTSTGVHTIKSPVKQQQIAPPPIPRITGPAIPYKPLNKPIKIGIISPATLIKYGELLKKGLSDLLRFDSTLSPYVSSVEHMYPSADEEKEEEAEQVKKQKTQSTRPLNNGKGLDKFLARVMSEQFDLIILQLHGAQHERFPVAFLPYFNNPAYTHSPLYSLLLLHRPEEILERHFHGYYDYQQLPLPIPIPDNAENSHHSPLLSLLQRNELLADKANTKVHVNVLLGEAYRKQLLRFTDDVIAIPHGFYDLLPPASAAPTSSSSIAFDYGCVGSVTTWGEMRWISDVLELHKEWLKSKEKRKHEREEAFRKKVKKTGVYEKTKEDEQKDRENDRSERVFFLVAGKFERFYLPVEVETANSTHEVEEVEIYEMDMITQKFSDRIKIIQAKSLEEGWNLEFSDLLSLKKYLYAQSDEGKKVVVIRGDFSSSASGLSSFLNSAIDFNVQLYREVTKDFAPKVEYSGILHARPGGSIPIVFESPSMADVEVEGLVMIQVPYDNAHTNNTITSASSSSTSSSSSPWYAQSHYIPQFSSPAVINKLWWYRQHPSFFLSHRAQMIENTKVLSMRHVAKDWIATIIEQFKLK